MSGGGRFHWLNNVDRQRAAEAAAEAAREAERERRATEEAAGTRRLDITPQPRPTLPPRTHPRPSMSIRRPRANTSAPRPTSTPGDELDQ